MAQGPLIVEAAPVAVVAVVTVTVGPSPGFGAAVSPPPAAEPEPFTGKGGINSDIGYRQHAEVFLQLLSWQKVIPSTHKERRNSLGVDLLLKEAGRREISYPSIQILNPDTLPMTL